MKHKRRNIKVEEQKYSEQTEKYSRVRQKHRKMHPDAEKHRKNRM